eukprot:CAMPEP_0116877318 /NCGR_PEP_ID=MMETSP0463-20121206/9098_1 /TAXON_ID=181622 /ORGANISM="Strombidinopsis sp, Strain SopsisLIS2011" /LENGTH=44 /DNA_ID= /DNA_START= /DNA_END= /DNA_ORIENTATION=
MVNWYKLANSLSVNLFILNQDVADITVKVEHSNVKHSNLVNFIS